MTRVIDFNGVGTIPVQCISYEPDNNRFVVVARPLDRISTPSETYRVYVRFPAPQKVDAPEDGCNIALFNPNHSESDVRMIRLSPLGSRTVGWLCTVTALASNNHKYSSDPHFRRAAFMNARHLLHSQIVWKRTSIQNDSTVELVDIVDDNASILTVFRPFVSSYAGTECTELLPSLHRIGFVPFTPQSAAAWKPGTAALNEFNNGHEHLTLDPFPASEKYSEFIAEVFKDLLPPIPSSILRFFIYYQIIEALLDGVLLETRSKALRSMIAEWETSERIKSVIEKVQEASKGSSRMERLFSEYSDSDNKEDLRLACNSLLIACGIDEKPSAPEALYKVRNTLFHEMRSMTGRRLLRLDNVNNELQVVVPDLLLNFSLIEREVSYQI